MPYHSRLFQKGRTQGGKGEKELEVPPPAIDLKAEVKPPPEPEFGPESGEYVGGVAKVSLRNLARGATRFEFDCPIVPFSTVRATAGLDWRTRPGNYVQSQSRIEGSIRCVFGFPPKLDRFHTHTLPH
jgi:hypothetical protein